MSSTIITSPESGLLATLCQQLAEQAGQLDQTGDWPRRQLELCASYGVFRWFLPAAWGGLAWSDLDVIRGYLKLSQACLTTTFVITQLTGASRRIAASGNEELQQRLLPALAAGEQFATVGISHLTTSRRHLSRPVLRAEPIDGGYRLDGFSPWVTGARHADQVVTGATLDDGRQLLAVLPTDLPGVSADEPAPLLGLTASCTGPFQMDNVSVPEALVLAGPEENVMATGVGARSGGLQTSTLAIGHAAASIEFLHTESQRRDELQPVWSELDRERSGLEHDLLALATGETVCSNEALRQRANSLVVRAAQAALAAAKGTGYASGHSAGRWCRESLFFLVWSCPQPVMQANLCELAGITD